MAHSLRERQRELLAAEVPLGPVKRTGSFRVAIAYPNLYFVGMSNLGMQSVYRMLNDIPEVVCERVFLPEDVHTEELERTGRPLTSIESGTELRQFDMIAFSVLFENDYLHVLKMLRMAGIPLRAADRGPGDPIIVFGGSGFKKTADPPNTTIGSFEPCSVARSGMPPIRSILRTCR